MVHSKHFGLICESYFRITLLTKLFVSSDKSPLPEDALQGLLEKVAASIKVEEPNVLTSDVQSLPTICLSPVKTAISHETCLRKKDKENQIEQVFET